jgi:hypothetical protein
VTRRPSRKFAQFSVVAVLSFVAYSAPAHAAGWTRDPGHFYLQLGSSFAFATDRYLADGSTGAITVPKFANNAAAANNSNFQQLLSDLYFELGTLPRLTLFGDIPFMSERQQNPGGDVTYSSNYLGDMMFGARFGVLLEPFVFSVEARLGIPTGDPKLNIPTGSGDFREELRLVASKSFDDLAIPLYFDAEFGYMARGAGRVHDPLSAAADKTSLVNFAPEIVVHGELGAHLFRCAHQERVIVSVGIDYRGSTTKLDTMGAAFLAIYPSSGEYTTFSASAMVFVWHGIGFMARYAHTLEGLNLPVLTTVGGALFASY